MRYLRRPRHQLRLVHPRSATTWRAAHSCAKRSKKGAFFKSLKKDVFYAVCVNFPSGKHLCAHAQPAQQGTLYVNKITSTQVGVHTVVWYVNGNQVGSTSFRVTG